MSADDQGNDITAVTLAVTGSLGIALVSPTLELPTPTEGASPSLRLGVDWSRVGLLTEDGGFQWAIEADGDAIVFFQDGYSIPSGLSNVTLTVKAAEYNRLVRHVAHGAVADANGYLTIDGGGHALRFALFTEEIFHSGAIRRRVAGLATVQSATPDQSTRGEVNGTELVFKVSRSPELGMKHIGEWMIGADGQPVSGSPLAE